MISICDKFTLCDKIMNQYYVYILRNKSDTVFYVGVTNDLVRRVYEHKNKLTPGYTSRYNINILVWFEVHNSIENAILREKQIKNWRREKKKLLIGIQNPTNRDLWDDVVK